MSTNGDEVVSSGDIPETAVSAVEDEAMETVHYSQESVHVTAEADLITDKQDDLKTIDEPDNDITEDEQLNTKRSRELKSLLALSKEANLDTNISYKRKSTDTFKLKEVVSMIAKPGSEGDQTLKKVKTEKADKFPITAESELESATGDSSNAMEVSVSDKSKKDEHKGKDVPNVEERRNIKDIKSFKPNKDKFCWRCHREGVNICCETCPRSYHQKCLKQTISDVNFWPCPECVTILKAESTQTRSPAMKGMTLEHLCSLLKFAVKRMIECNGSEPFLHPVNEKEFPEYKNYITQPMNLTSLEKNIKDNLYGSTQAFEADAKWILHNSIIFNSYQSKLTTFAKTIIKICKQEMAEIENCPSCYLNANTKKSTWFVEVCPKPHILVWAKLKGFPYWPAKAMCTNSSSMVDVRFFGAHDRAWVPSKECFLYSRRDPNSNKQKRNDIIECMREVEVYISNIKALYGEFNYAPFKLPYDPDNELKQLLLFIPRYRPNAPPPKKRPRLSDAKMKTPSKKDSEKDEQLETDSKETKENMEGYGTDDEMNESESLDTDRRAMMLRQRTSSSLSKVVESDESEESSSEEEEEEEGEDEGVIQPDVDDDTQVPSNIPADKPLRGNIRTRGGLNFSPGKLKTIPRRVSDENNSQKRLSVDESTTPKKISRRNSDQSVKSDSSRLSTLSDKINRVDILENVELSLGNTPDSFITSSSSDNSETRKKPIQLEIENLELSISPPNKIKITDRLMKKLSSSDEDVSKSVTDKEQADIKSQTDILLEKYKNLVKEKSRGFIAVGACTSFASTSVVSDGFCESSSDAKKSNIEEKMEIGEKSDAELICLKENQKDKKIAVGTSETVISSSDNLKSIQDMEEIEDLEKEESKPVVVSSISEIQSNEEKMTKLGTEMSKTTEKSRVAREATSNKGESTSKVIVPKKDNLNIHMKKKDTSEKLTNIESKKQVTNPSVPVDQNKEICTIKKESETISSTKINPFVSVDRKLEEKVVPKSEEITDKRTIEMKSTEKQKSDISNKKMLPALLNIEETKHAGVSKPTKVATNNEAKSKETVNKVKVTGGNKIIIKDKKTEEKEITSTELKTSSIEREAKNIEDKSEGGAMDKGDTQDVDQADSNSSDDQDVVLDDTQIDEANIRNIIHSSLNKVEKRPIEETFVDDKTLDNIDETNNHDVSISRSAKKAKLDNHIKVPTEPNFKIVPIQSILDKNIEAKPADPSVLSSNPILLKKLSQSEPVKSPLALPTHQELVCVEIKSEPDSSDEEMEESEYMEKKRKYLSALNISERSEEAAIPKKHEIRTRSKTEEMGRPKLMDNLSKVIDEVATSYSAKHESIRKSVEKKSNNQPTVNSQTPEDRRKATPQENGEIFVKSFAKLQQQQQLTRPLQPRSQPPPNPTKPKPISYTIKPLTHAIRRETVQKPNPELPTSTLTRITTTPNVSTANQQNPPAPPANKTLESLNSSGNVLILTQPGVILPTSQQLTYNTGSFVTFVPSQQNMAMVQSPQVINAVMAPSLHQGENVQTTRPNVEIHRSQNYIPQHEGEGNQKRSAISNAPSTVSNTTNGTNQLPSGPSEVPSLTPLNDNPSGSTSSATSVATEPRTEATDDEFSLLHSMVPESVSRAISEVLCRPPPKLKPRPPGPLSRVFDTGNPSGAGPVSAKINSISHRLGDYFRGMLIEMLEDLGKSNNTEATISSLKHEIESLQHKHTSEMMDIRKNVCTILKDIQGSIAEERERIVDETRSACELETLRRIEEAKSKQWCANCGKEAQFYCCWNTSYCDYPCQQKHWSKHMGKCTQHAGQPQPQPVPTPAIRPQSQITFRPATPKTFTGRLLTKPTKVYLNRSTNSNKAVSTFKSTPAGHLTLLDTSNLEFLTSTSMGAKFIASTSLFTKVKTVSSTVTSPSNGAQQPVVLNQNNKMNNSLQIVKPLPSTSSNNVSNVISDEEFESE